MFPVGTGINRGPTEFSLSIQSVPRRYGDKPNYDNWKLIFPQCSP
ncbi:hypothetical protein XBJ2_1880004 [Xenorhabdus bovienii str. Jollieti]|uniref:Uncharacterized protein n=1 Tax=Xenorhabdus bovienii (strain SS-2004) TaxID=406818 RepID=D3V5A6_XENBS|nr:hypothetical protein XBJ1_3717 [Xenorhabdus bovienii SS-2004]CDH28613.1 hypothetical protein XBJ2_1880004 [Xenorhabdus bovienii str. Jollieti]